MSQDDRDDVSDGANAAEKAGDVRKTRGIRFPESEWGRGQARRAGHEKPVTCSSSASASSRSRGTPRGGSDAGERRTGPGCGFDGAADQADVPLHLVPGGRKAGRDGPRRPRGRAGKAGCRGPGVPGIAQPERRRLSEAGARPDRLRDGNLRNPAYVARVSVADSGRQPLERRRDARVSVRVSVDDRDRQGPAPNMRTCVYRTDTRSILQERDAGRRRTSSEDETRMGSARARATSIIDASGVRPKAAPAVGTAKSSSIHDGEIDAGEPGGGEPRGD